MESWDRSLLGFKRSTAEKAYTESEVISIHAHFSVFLCETQTMRLLSTGVARQILIYVLCLSSG